ncbi:MAG TPA: 30S ribosomal protein S2 [bacterium]|uniref:Small ribosomal subunit protein uS2 n=1 Tax=candidate division TA06 bacterium ADurb.Bin417 TaxID=1852828 RepID=A0A1V5MJK3_UNCT6|nr:MAG: 30S ribosomal protein S2 [candidate division TA06 bacterium ADurb.Bin417]HNQ35045.1 30S ribosomal protein S2 [bacterium]HNS48192.1 30S ribosomal protein S2 [bacterium]
MVGVTLQELLESGLYFGHPSKQFDARMKPFIFGKRQGIYIIDLEKTRVCLEKACEFLKEMAREGKVIMFVGTKRQARELVRTTAETLDLPYMSNRWLGGTMTNYQTLRVRIERLNTLEAKDTSGALDKLSKWDATMARRERDRLMKNLSGLRKLNRLPDILLVVDVRKEENAILEARKLGLKIVGVVDTNSNPELVDYPIPANDDGIKGLRILFAEFATAIKSGQEERGRLQKAAEEKEKKAAREAAAAAQKPPVPEAAPAVEPVAAAAPVAKPAAKPAVPAAPAAEPAEAEAGSDESPAAGKKAVTKPKPRPRIRSKVRRSAPATAARKPAARSAGAARLEKKTTAGVEKKSKKEE